MDNGPDPIGGALQTARSLHDLAGPGQDIEIEAVVPCQTDTVERPQRVELVMNDLLIIVEGDPS